MRCLAGSIHTAEVPEARQPAERPLRGGGYLRHYVLLEMACGPRLRAGASRRADRQIYADHDGVPAEATARELERRRRDGEAPAPQGGGGKRLGRRGEVASRELRSEPANPTACRL